MHWGLFTVLNVQPLAVYCMAYAHWNAAEQALAQMAAEDPMFNALKIKEAAPVRK